MKVALSGPFQSTGMKSLPELALTATANGEANGEKIDFEGGLTVLNDRAYIGYNGNQYEVDPTTFGFIKSGFEKSEQEGEGESKGAEANACQKAATSLDLSEFVDNLENEGGEEVDGVKTTKLSGDLNPQKAVDAAIKLAETPACSSELEAAGPLPLDQLKSLRGQVHRRDQKGARRHLRRRRRPHRPQSGRRPDDRTEGLRRKDRNLARSHPRQGERKGDDQGPGGRQAADQPLRRTRDQPEPDLPACSKAAAPKTSAA